MVQSTVWSGLVWFDWLREVACKQVVVVCEREECECLVRGWMREIGFDGLLVSCKLRLEMRLWMC